jgi:hypothetical protein
MRTQDSEKIFLRRIAQMRDRLAMETPRDRWATVGVRLSQATVDRLDALSTRLARPGMRVARGAAMRVALEAGLMALESRPQTGHDRAE